MTGRTASPDGPGQDAARARLRIGIAVALILVTGTALRLPDFTQPWRHTGGSARTKGLNGALYSTIARNHLRYGFRNTRLAMVRCGGVRTVEELGNHRYLSHPPLFPVLLAVSFRVFGQYEWSARLVPLLFSVLSLLMLFVVCRLVAGTGPAMIALVLMAVTPMAVSYGTFVDVQGFQVMFMALVVFYFYWKWYTSRRPVFFGAMLAAFLVGAALDWPIYLLALGLFLHFLLNPGARGYSRLILLLPATAVLALGSTLIYVGLLSPDRSLAGILRSFQFQSVASSSAIGDRGIWIAGVKHLTLYFLAQYTLPLLFLAAFWMVRALLAGLFRRAPAGGGLVFCFTFTGLVYIVLFPAGSLAHDFWSYFLIPALCAAVAFLLWETSRWTAVVTTSVLVVVLGVAAWGHRESGISHESSYYVQAGGALQAKTRPEDTVTVVALRTESYLYAYYGDRTIHYIEPGAVVADPAVLDKVPGRWVVVVGDLDLYGRGMPPREYEAYQAARDIAIGRLSSRADPIEAGPLLIFPNRVKGPPATPGPRSSPR